MLGGKALAPSNLNLHMIKNRTQSAIRTIDNDNKKNSSFAFDASLTDLEDRSPAYLNTERAGKTKLYPTSKSPTIPKT